MIDFFDIARVAGFLLEPANALFLVLLAAAALLWVGRWRAARVLVTSVVLVLAALVFVPVASFLLMPLEQRFPMPSPLPLHVDGIIILGGAQQPRLSRAHGQAALNDRAERMTSFLALARHYPKAKLVASGGQGDSLHPHVNEAFTTRLFLREQGFDASRVLFEARSRNTYENIVYSKEVAAPQPGETWLLVTSAADVPRAVGVFRKLQWPVVPVPCDYNALPAQWSPSVSLLGDLRLFNHALHEWVGLAVYYLTGKTESFFPAPVATTAS